MKLPKADLAGAQWLRANVDGGQLQRADLSAANLLKAGLIGAGLHRANLTGAQPQKAYLIRAHLWEAILLWEALLLSARLRGGYSAGTQLYGAALTDAEGLTTLDGAVRDD